MFKKHLPVAVIFIILASYILTSVGFVLTEMWNMFIYPLVGKDITFWHSLGILATVGIFRISRILEKNNFGGREIILYLVSPWVTYCLGLVYAHFMQ